MEISIRKFDRLAPRHRFESGRVPIDRWFKNHSKKCSDRVEYRVFTAHIAERADAVGYYALQIGNESIDALANKPDDFTKNYTAFPAVHLAYLGVQKEFQGRGVGTLLLTDVFEKTYTISECAGLYALTLQSLDEYSTRFYKGLGFTPYSAGPNQPKMLMPIRTIRKLVMGEE